MVGMSGLEIGWTISLMAALWFVPVAAVRVVAYLSDEVDQTHTMLIVAMVAAVAALLSVNTWVFLSVLLLA
jgi:hypothetical protein